MGTLEMAPADVPEHLGTDAWAAQHMEPVAILELVPAPGAIRSGRRWVTDAARAQGAGDDVADLVELLASELLTNAALHGSHGSRVTVHVVRRQGTLRVTVHDSGAGQPVLRVRDDAAEGGRGLQLVDVLATSWGIESHRTGGKAVWFETPLTP